MTSQPHIDDAFITDAYTGANNVHIPAARRVDSTHAVPVADNPSELMVKHLADVTSAEWTRRCLVADLDEPTLSDVRDGLLRTAAALGITSVTDLAKRSSEVIRRVTGHDDLTTLRSSSSNDAAHLQRNVLAALIMTDALNSGTDPVAAISDLPVLPARPGGRKRSLNDDEVLLLRLRASHLMTTTRSWHAACQYALVDDGVFPSETTAITIGDFDDPRHPTTIQAPGVQTLIRPRVLTLSPWSRLLLREALDKHLARHDGSTSDPIAYRGNDQAGGRVASAAASGNIKRGFIEVGIAKSLPMPMGLVKWRNLLIASTAGINEAYRVSGRLSLRAFDDFVGDELGDLVNVLPPSWLIAY